MQCKDIPEIPILVFISKHGGIGCNWFGIDEFENERSVRHAMPAGTPNNLVRAKMTKLIEKGYVSGCPCGCRGDYELTIKGIEHIVLSGSGTDLQAGFLSAALKNMARADVARRNMLKNGTADPRK